MTHRWWHDTIDKGRGRYCFRCNAWDQKVEPYWWWERDKAIFFFVAWVLSAGFFSWLFYPLSGWWLPIPIGAVAMGIAYMMPDMDVG